MRSLNVLCVVFLTTACSLPEIDTRSPVAVKSTVEGTSLNLLDETLSQWDSYLSYRFKPDYNGEKPVEAPFGFNAAQASDIFTVTQKDGAPELRISGEIYGSLITKVEYRNYHLSLKVRWGDIKWDPRQDLLKDTGILYHSVGPHGAEYWRSWMQGQELQIMQGHMGDYWNQATSAMDVRAFKPEYIMNPIGSTTEPFFKVGHREDIQGLVIRSDNHESPNGEWTQIELICFEGQSLHIVNGNVVMVLRNSRYEKDGEMVPLLEGKIQLQSEAAEVFYKDIELSALSALPAQYAKLFE